MNAAPKIDTEIGTEIFTAIDKPSVEKLPFEESDLNTSIPARFRRIMASLPTKHLAYVDDKESLTYQALDQQSNHLAVALVEQLGAASDKLMPVALLLPHEAVSLVGMLGTLKAGHFYVPLDEGQSEVVLQRIIQDCTPQALVTTSALRNLASNLMGENGQIPILYIDALPLQAAAASLSVEIAPQAYASIQYTSGSTGLPRGIIRTHIQTLKGSYLAHHDLGYCPSDRVAHLFSYAHAATTRAIFGGLLNGATIYTQKMKEISPLTLYGWVQKYQITQLFLSAGVMRGMGDLPENYPLLPSLRTIYTSGEALQRQDIERLWRLLPADCQVVAGLSATEASNYTRITFQADTPWESERVPAGYITPFVEVMIVDENGQPLPPNNAGEIVVRSRYLCAGYWNQPELTAAKFLPDPDGGDRRIFLTGDLGRMTPDGLLEHLGRKDFMVKIRGFRVELEAIEAALRKVETIQNAVVTTQKLATGDQRLIAYVVPRRQPGPTVTALRTHLAERIPDYMVPSVFVTMTSLPVTIGGKMDRKALPPPGAERPELAVAYVAPRDALEEQVCDIWAEFLQIAPVGVDDDFFDLGGDSLLSTRMALQVEQRLGHSLPSAFFRTPTVAHLVSLYQSVPATREATESKEVTKVRLPTARLKTRLAKLLSGQANFRFHRHNAFEGWVRHLPYRQACRWFAWWTGQPLVINAFYRAEYDNFQRLLEELDAVDVIPRQAFQLLLTGHLIRISGLHKPMPPLSRGYFPSLQASPYRIWRSLAHEIEQAGSDPTKLDALATVSGFSHLQDAYRQRRGVILLTYHHAAGRHTKTMIARRLQSHEIPTLSELQALGWHKLMHKQATQTSLPASSAAYVAELTLRAQQMLRQGHLLQIQNDFSIRQADSAPVPIGRRSYQLRPGFAELALNTGAVMIPFQATRRLDGQIHTAFQAPLQPEDSRANRAQQVQSLVSQYAQFLETSWRTVPESLSWGMIEHYMERPQTTSQTTSTATKNL